MIIEFYGLPGSGKTTLCKKISNEKNMENPMIFYKNNFLGKVIFHIFLCTFFFNPKIRIKYKKAKKLLDCKRYVNSINEKIDIFLYIKYISFIYYLEYKKDNIVIDEGVIHYLIALNAEFDVEFEKLLVLFDLFCINNKRIIYKCTECGVNESIDNCVRRNRKDAPIDFLAKDKLYMIENRYKEAEIYFSKYLGER